MRFQKADFYVEDALPLGTKDDYLTCLVRHTVNFGKVLSLHR